MSWLQLELETRQEQVEVLTELLEQFGALSVSFSAVSGEPIFDTPDTPAKEKQQLWQKTRLQALLHPDVDLDIMLVCLRDRVGADNIFSHQIESIKDKDWVSEFQASNQPIIFSDRICISPSWCEPPESDMPIIILDPGLAFGTGSHPTTSLCINWLAEHDLKDKVVIDYGCGSGILAMVAARLGAEKVYAVDIDPQAIQAANENIKRNSLQEKIEPALVNEQSLPVADVLVANILMNPLQELTERFEKLVKPEGHIVLSGLLHVQADECLASYAKFFNMDVPVFDLEWTRLHGIKL